MSCNLEQYSFIPKEQKKALFKMVLDSLEMEKDNGYEHFALCTTTHDLYNSNLISRIEREFILASIHNEGYERNVTWFYEEEGHVRINGFLKGYYVWNPESYIERKEWILKQLKQL